MTPEDWKKAEEFVRYSAKKMNEAQGKPDSEAKPPSCPQCHAQSDGECSWRGCPQKRDGEPEKSGRHCPFDKAWSDYYDATEL